MAMTTPTDIQITPQAAMLVPTMGAEPILTALENLNYLWQWHRPPFVDVCPTGDSSRNAYVIPIKDKPSADGLTYTFEHRVMPDTTSTCTITVDYCTTYSGGTTTWHNIYTVTVGTVATGLLTQTDTGVIPANAKALRVQYGAAVGTVMVHHILVYPSPSNASAGIQHSGFVPFDDGVLTLTGSPIHTEFLNRIKLSTLSILRDRYQCCLSFLQPETGTPPFSPSVGPFGMSALPTVRCFLPYAGQTATLHLVGLGTVTGGTGYGVVQVRQVGGAKNESILFTSDGVVREGDLTLHPQNYGKIDAFVDLEIAAQSPTYRTDLRAMFGWWRPTE